VSIWASSRKEQNIKKVSQDSQSLIKLVIITSNYAKFQSLNCFKF
jgi:hypothetical protein